MNSSPEGKDDAPRRRSTRISRVSLKPEETVLTPKKRKSTVKNVSEEPLETVGTPRTRRSSVTAAPLRNVSEEPSETVGTPRKRKSTVASKNSSDEPTEAVATTGTRRTTRGDITTPTKSVGSRRTPIKQAAALTKNEDPQKDLIETKRTPRKSLRTLKTEQGESSSKESDVENTNTSRTKRTRRFSSTKTIPEEESSDDNSSNSQAEETKPISKTLIEAKRRSRKSVYFKNDVDELPSVIEEEDSSLPESDKPADNHHSKPDEVTVPALDSSRALVPKHFPDEHKVIIKEGNTAEPLLPSITSANIPSNSKSSPKDCPLSPSNFFNFDDEVVEETNSHSSEKIPDDTKTSQTPVGAAFSPSENLADESLDSSFKSRRKLFEETIVAAPVQIIQTASFEKSKTPNKDKLEEISRKDKNVDNLSNVKDKSDKPDCTESNLQKDIITVEEKMESVKENYVVEDTVKRNNEETDVPIIILKKSPTKKQSSKCFEDKSGELTIQETNTNDKIDITDRRESSLEEVETNLKEMVDREVEPLSAPDGKTTEEKDEETNVTDNEHIKCTEQLEVVKDDLDSTITLNSSVVCDNISNNSENDKSDINKVIDNDSLKTSLENKADCSKMETLESISVNNEVKDSSKTSVEISLDKNEQSSGLATSDSNDVAEGNNKSDECDESSKEISQNNIIETSEVPEIVDKEVGGDSLKEKSDEEFVRIDIAQEKSTDCDKSGMPDSDDCSNIGIKTDNSLDVNEDNDSSRAVKSPPESEIESLNKENAEQQNIIDTVNDSPKKKSVDENQSNDDTDVNISSDVNNSKICASGISDDVTVKNDDSLSATNKHDDNVNKLGKVTSDDKEVESVNRDNLEQQNSTAENVINDLNNEKSVSVTASDDKEFKVSDVDNSKLLHSDVNGIAEKNDVSNTSKAISETDLKFVNNEDMEEENNTVENVINNSINETSDVNNSKISDSDVCAVAASNEISDSSKATAETEAESVNNEDMEQENNTVENVRSDTKNKTSDANDSKVLDSDVDVVAASSEVGDSSKATSQDEAESVNNEDMEQENNTVENVSSDTQNKTSDVNNSKVSESDVGVVAGSDEVSDSSKTTSQTEAESVNNEDMEQENNTVENISSDTQNKTSDANNSKISDSDVCAVAAGNELGDSSKATAESVNNEDMEQENNTVENVINDSKNETSDANNSKISDSDVCAVAASNEVGDSSKTTAETEAESVNNEDSEQENNTLANVSSDSIKETSDANNSKISDSDVCAVAVSDEVSDSSKATSQIEAESVNNEDVEQENNTVENVSSDTQNTSDANNLKVLDSDVCAVAVSDEVSDSSKDIPQTEAEDVKQQNNYIQNVSGNIQNKTSDANNSKVLDSDVCAVAVSNEVKNSSNATSKKENSDRENVKDCVKLENLEQQNNTNDDEINDSRLEKSYSEIGDNNTDPDVSSRAIKIENPDDETGIKGVSVPPDDDDNSKILYADVSCISVGDDVHKSSKETSTNHQTTVDDETGSNDTSLDVNNLRPISIDVDAESTTTRNDDSLVTDKDCDDSTDSLRVNPDNEVDYVNIEEEVEEKQITIDSEINNSRKRKCDDVCENDCVKIERLEQQNNTDDSKYESSESKDKGNGAKQDKSTNVIKLEISDDETGTGELLDKIKSNVSSETPSVNNSNSNSVENLDPVSSGSGSKIVKSDDGEPENNDECRENDADVDSSILIVESNDSSDMAPEKEFETEADTRDTNKSIELENNDVDKGKNCDLPKGISESSEIVVELDNAKKAEVQQVDDTGKCVDRLKKKSQRKEKKLDETKGKKIKTKTHKSVKEERSTEGNADDGSQLQNGLENTAEVDEIPAIKPTGLSKKLVEPVEDSNKNEMNMDLDRKGKKRTNNNDISELSKKPKVQNEIGSDEINTEESLDKNSGEIRNPKRKEQTLKAEHKSKNKKSKISLNNSDIENISVKNVLDSKENCSTEDKSMKSSKRKAATDSNVGTKKKLKSVNNTIKEVCFPVCSSKIGHFTINHDKVDNNKNITGELKSTIDFEVMDHNDSDELIEMPGSLIAKYSCGFQEEIISTLSSNTIEYEPSLSHVESEPTEVVPNTKFLTATYTRETRIKRKSIKKLFERYEINDVLSVTYDDREGPEYSALVEFSSKKSMMKALRLYSIEYKDVNIYFLAPSEMQIESYRH